MTIIKMNQWTFIILLGMTFLFGGTIAEDNNIIIRATAIIIYLGIIYGLFSLGFMSIAHYDRSVKKDE